MRPVFLNLSEVLRVHCDQLQRYGGASGVRDIGLLQSAVTMPAMGFGGRCLHQDLFEMATLSATIHSSTGTSAAD